MSRLYPRGSEWRQWDLHIHTPASFHWQGERLTEGAEASDREAVEGAIASLKGAMQGDSTEDIRQKTDQLDEATRKLGDATKARNSDAGATTDGIVDAEFEEADDPKN